MSEAKLIRKQIKNVLQDKMQELLAQEVIATIKKELDAHLIERLKQIEGSIGLTLKKIDERAKDVQSYIVRELSKAAPIPPAINEESKNNEEKSQESSPEVETRQEGSAEQA